jgi:hypothetical protein
MRSEGPPEDLDTQVPDKQGSVGFQLFTLLLRRGGGWFANHALSTFLNTATEDGQLTAAGRRGCNRRASWPPSLGRRHLSPC